MLKYILEVACSYSRWHLIGNSHAQCVQIGCDVQKCLLGNHRSFGSSGCCRGSSAASPNQRDHIQLQWGSGQPQPHSVMQIDSSGSWYWCTAWSRSLHLTWDLLHLETPVSPLPAPAQVGRNQVGMLHTSQGSCIRPMDGAPCHSIVSEVGNTSLKLGMDPKKSCCSLCSLQLQSLTLGVQGEIRFGADTLPSMCSPVSPASRAVATTPDNTLTRGCYLLCGNIWASLQLCLSPFPQG